MAKVELMLQIQEISKEYRTGELVQKALDHVSLNLRDNEFVSVLGPSGSGKTTLLNIIGGLDRYDSGDLVINGISTKEYGDREWDTYRNHSIGFVFQSYNLIAHQSILANVELALTIGGVSKSQRRARAQKALEEVGLGDQGHKRPSQMSGGQMQRVAIARALVNDPDIVLADEPTGALDSETSLQVMELLKKVAQTRLVVMVTHNPELAEQYSTRIVKLRDGSIVSDSDPYLLKRSEQRALRETPAYAARGVKKTERSASPKKAKMGFGTSLALSANNLRTKKARTLLTSFAGSIGIIGIALILALSSGVNTYIEDTQRSTMTSYPITIESQAFNMGSMASLGESKSNANSSAGGDAPMGVTADIEMLKAQHAMKQSITENDLTAFKKYLDDPNSEINKYVGNNGVSYSYATKFSVFRKNAEGSLVDTDGSRSPFSAYSTQQNSAAAMNNMAVWMGANQDRTGVNFSQVMAPPNGNGVNQSVKDSYSLLEGEWAQGADDVMLVLPPSGSVDASALHDLGFITDDQYTQITDAVENDVEPEAVRLDFADVIGREYYVVPTSVLYKQNSEGLYEALVNTVTASEVEAASIPVKVSGVIQANDDDSSTLLTALVYTKALTEKIVEATDASDVVRAQEASVGTSVLSGAAFESGDGEAAAADAGAMMSMMGTAGMPEASAQFPTTYDDTLKLLGKVDYDAPSSIDIYVDSFDAKDGIARAIEHYNAEVPEVERITYTDFVALLTSSITSIINAISYVLIAFVAVSLIVSCIMIGIITHISVLERTKEIGILRALGASKRNIAQVFNAETVIIGLCAGVLGVGISMLLTIPINAIIRHLIENDSIRAAVPPVAAVVLVLISMVITVIGGIMPARTAAKKDPVIALRTE